jgi:hypothetical protein
MTTGSRRCSAHQRPGSEKRTTRSALADYGFADVGTLSNGRFAPPQAVVPEKTGPFHERIPKASVESPLIHRLAGLSDPSACERGDLLDVRDRCAAARGLCQQI